MRSRDGPEPPLGLAGPLWGAVKGAEHTGTPAVQSLVHVRVRPESATLFHGAGRGKARWGSLHAGAAPKPVVLLDSLAGLSLAWGASSLYGQDPPPSSAPLPPASKGCRCGRAGGKGSAESVPPLGWSERGWLRRPGVPPVVQGNRLPHVAMAASQGQGLWASREGGREGPCGFQCPLPETGRWPSWGLIQCGLPTWGWGEQHRPSFPFRQCPLQPWSSEVLSRRRCLARGSCASQRVRPPWLFESAGRRPLGSLQDCFPRILGRVLGRLN